MKRSLSIEGAVEAAHAGQKSRIVCPGHPDKIPSLDVGPGAKGGVVMICRAGCQTPDLMRAAGLPMRRLAPPKGVAPRSAPANEWEPQLAAPNPATREDLVDPTLGPPSAVYEYRTVAGLVSCYVRRWDRPGGGKDIRPLSWCLDATGHGRWLAKAIPHGRALYGAHLLAGRPDAHVLVVEGEKTADAARRLLPEYVVLTWQGGSKAVAKADWAPLKGRDVTIWPDSDAPGIAAAREIAALIPGSRVVTPPADTEQGWDLADAESGGWTTQNVTDYIASNAGPPDERPAPAANGEPAQDRNYEVDTSGPHAATQAETEPLAYDGPPWPAPLEAPAFHGLAGDIVRRIEPHSEADPAALLINVLVAFGNAAGRNPHFVVEATRHGANEFAVLVGATATGRKGTSWGWVERLFKAADQYWAGNCLVSGLSSGEGLVWRLRDPKDREDSPPASGDKRLLALESEFAAVLASAARRDNTVSAFLRDAWDGRTLRTLTRNGGKGGDVATDPHVSILAHVTAAELKVKLTETDAANGFVNRFLWVATRRSKCLPHGGGLSDTALKDLADRLHGALHWAKERGRLEFDAKACAKWEEVYPKLTEDVDGPLGMAITRGAPHVLRLATIYALLDCGDTIEAQHLESALAVWRYCRATAELIFGGLSPVALRFHFALSAAFPSELDRRELHRHGGNHVRADLMADALGQLRRYGLATSRRESTGGAPRELWRATARGAN